MMFRLCGALAVCLALVACRSNEAAPNPPAGSYRAESFDVRVGETSEKVKGAAVSDAFFVGGKIQPVLGRAILPQENGSMRVALLSYRLWQSKLHGDPGAIGRSLQVNGQNVTLVGIMPRDFAFPDGAELWVPK